MKKIINGKKYDTETATVLAEWWNGYGLSDFNYTKETLYRKKNGEFFIYGEGGPKSPYAIYEPLCGYGSGENIVPLTEESAKDWAMENLDCDDYEELFGEVEE